MPPTDSTGAGDEGEIARLCEEISDQLRRGESVNIEQYAASWPQHADELRRILPTIRVMASLKAEPRREAVAPVAESTVAGEVLGDFRLVREIGRGGMGVVYEAQQLSLRRRVALKVLPFASVLDSRQLRRFQIEAQAAALLHHPRIVPVHGVGCDRGVHYYAMQLIDGPTLADVILQRRSQEEAEAGQREPVGGPHRASTAGGPSAMGQDGDETSPRDVGVCGPDQAESRSECTSVPSTRSTPGVLSTSRDHRSSSYIGAAVQLAIDVAEALDYAHQEGVLHRDIKPGNLLMGARGQVWVTDFGLARVENEPALTMTGDLVGTLRYMSPEQAAGNPIAIDHRTDIYSLGATLYELLTLQPVFTAEDRQTLLRQVAFDDPRPPRQIERFLPTDLETILLKALAKSPLERYATAGAMAEDLQRFLDQKPIMATRPSLVDRAAKWAARNRILVTIGTIGLPVAVLLLAATNILIWQERGKTRVALERAVVEQMKAASEGRRAAQLARELQRHLYVSNVRLVEQFAGSGQRGQLTKQLNILRATAGNGSVRGFEWYYWWQRCRHDSLFVLPGHEQDVEGLALFPSGRRFATCAGRLVRIWDFETGRLLQELRATEPKLTAVAVSPDEKWLAVTSSRQDRLYVWDLSRATMVYDWAINTATGAELHFVGDANRLFSTDWSGSGKLWDLNAGVELRAVGMLAPNRSRYAWNRSGSRVASGGDDGVVRVLDLARTVVDATFTFPGARVVGLRFLPDEQQLACTTDDGQIRFLQIRSQQIVHTAQLPVNNIVCAEFDADCEKLATIDGRSEAKEWNTRSGECLATLQGVPATACRFAGNGQTVVAIGSSGFVGMWQPYLHPPVSLAGHARETWSVAFSPDGRLLASGSDDETVRVWNVEDACEVQILRGHEATVTSVVFSPDGATLASASLDASVKLWRVADGEAIATLQGHGRRACSLAFSPSGTWLASGGDEVVIWDVVSGKELARCFQSEQRRINGLCFSPDGSLLAVASSSNRVELVGTQDWQVVRSLDHDDEVWSVDFSPDGSLVATGDKAGNVSIWSTVDGQLRSIQRAHAAYVRSVRFTHDGKTLASGGDGQQIILWDPVTGGKMCALRGHTAEIYSLAFSPSDGLLASGAYDGTIRLWHAERHED